MITPQNKPAPPEHIEELDSLTEGRLPRDYLDFLLHSDGYEEGIPIMPYNVDLRSAKDVIAGIHGESYEIPPGFIEIGTSGEGEIILLDMRKEPPWVASLPAIWTDLDELYLLGRSFAELVTMLGKEPDPEMEKAFEQLDSIPDFAAAALDAEFWTEDQIPDKVREFEIDKYAPEYRAIAEIPGCSHFIGVKRDDGTVWNVPFVGTQYLDADKMADSLEQLHEYMTQLKELQAQDAWRYYERTETGF
ncbi:MAG: SMI1/KNR4 family protein [Cyanobacteria bacterium HKST-UBA02]|nr:SMI1/KNR4 family protein [Cyanobacteria bacterium HKST-UBA02]